jgi:hypothetical protein
MRSARLAIFFVTALAPAIARGGQSEAPLEDVTVRSLSGQSAAYSVPTSSCAAVKSSPIVVGEHLVLPLYEKSNKGDASCQEEPGPYAESVLGYHLGSQQVHSLFSGAGTEGTLAYDAATGRLYWPVLTQGAAWMIDPARYAVTYKGRAVGASTDSHGTFIGDTFYFGTINTPEEVCNARDNINKDCGALYAMDGAGNITHRLDMEEGFRTWIVGGPTTDGEALYVGTSPDCLGDACWSHQEGYQYRYGCSVVKVDKDLNILKSFDPGITGCLEGGDTEDAIAGEIVLGAEGDLWAQYTRPNEEGGKAYVYQLSESLGQRCSFGVDYSDGPDKRAAGFFQAPTIDRDGNAYVVFNLPRAGTTDAGAALYKVAPCREGCGKLATCEATQLAFVEGTTGYASATLVDDSHALLATEGQLRKVELGSGVVAGTWALGSDAEVHAAPVVHEGVIYIWSKDGTLTVIRDGGVVGYGSAIWPRFRADNQGSARPARAAGEEEAAPAQASGRPTPAHPREVPAGREASSDATADAEGSAGAHRAGGGPAAAGGRSDRSADARQGSEPTRGEAPQSGASTRQASDASARASQDPAQPAQISAQPAQISAQPAQITAQPAQTSAQPAQTPAKPAQSAAKPSQPAAKPAQAGGDAAGGAAGKRPAPPAKEAEEDEGERKGAKAGGRPAR